MLSDFSALDPHSLLALTVILPPFAPKLTAIEFVFCPLTIVAPLGTVHVYEVASETSDILYITLGWFRQGFTFPIIAESCGGILFKEISFTEGVLSPHKFIVETLT